MKSLNELIWNDENFNITNGDDETFNGDPMLEALCGGSGPPIGCYTVATGC